MAPDREFNRRMLRTVLTVAALALLLATLWTARSALMLIYISGLVAMGFSPLVRILERQRIGLGRRLPRALAILTIYLVIVGGIALVGLMVIPPLVDQAGELGARAPQMFNDLQRFLQSYHLIPRRLTIEEAVQSAPAGSGGTAINTVFNAIWSLVGGVFGVVTILILSFYLLVDGENQFKFVTRFVPVYSRERFINAARESVNKVSAWLGAQFILAGVMGTFTAVGLGLMGVPYFYVIALVAACGETVPIVGPIAAGITAVAVSLTVSPKLAAMVGVYFLVLHELEANVLVPKVMERRVGVSPVTVIIALLICSELWGLTGAVLAIPTAAILSVIVEELAPEEPGRRMSLSDQ